MNTFISWTVFIGQLVALFVVLRNTPVLLVNIVKAMKFKELELHWGDVGYIIHIICIMYLLFVGLPKFA